MALFGLGKKKDETKSSCCCGGTCTPETMEKAEEKKNSMGVKILGGGCAKCNQLEAATVEALTELGMDTTIEHIKEWGPLSFPSPSYHWFCCTLPLFHLPEPDRSPGRLKPVHS